MLGFNKVLVPLFTKVHKEAVLLVVVFVRLTTSGGQEARVSLAINELLIPLI